MVIPQRGGLIHIAGVVDRAEAEMLIECGAYHLGFPLVLGYHQEDLTTEVAAAIVEEFGTSAEFFLITYLKRAVDILALCSRLNVRCVQLHDEIASDEIAKLRDEAPWLKVIKSIIVRTDGAMAFERDIEIYSPFVDAFITDTHDPTTGAIGATGKTHDWEISRQIVKVSPHPVVLAGGLNPDNVADAIHYVRPAGIDVHTGIERSDGRKDREMTLRFVEEAQRGFASL